MPKGSRSSMPFRFCRYFHLFQRYLRSNSKVVVNRTDFWTFFALANFKGAVPPNFVLALTPEPGNTSSAKVSSGYTPNSEVISANLLHFKPIFDPPLKKVVRGTPAPGGKCASKTWWFSSACKNLGAEICSSEKCAFGGYDFTSRSPRSLDQISPDFFRLTHEKSR